MRGHVQRALEERELLSVWTRERNSIPKANRVRLSARIKRYIDRWVDCLDACYPGKSPDVLTAAVHATHGLIDSTSIWPEKSLKTPGLADILTGDGPAGAGMVGQRRVAPHHVRTEKRPAEATSDPFRLR